MCLANLVITKLVLARSAKCCFLTVQQNKLLICFLSSVLILSKQRLSFLGSRGGGPDGVTSLCKDPALNCNFLTDLTQDWTGQSKQWLLHSSGY